MSSTRERILDASLELFVEHGYTGTTVRQVMVACDLTPGALYHHFPSKDDLLFAIVDEQHDLADAALEAAGEQAGDDPARQIESLAAVLTAFHIGRPRETTVSNRDFRFLSAEHRASVIARRRRIRELFTGVLRDGVAGGAFALEEAAIESAAMAIINMIVWTAEWFDPAGPMSAAETAALHGRLALRIAQGDPVSSGARPSARKPPLRAGRPRPRR